MDASDLVWEYCDHIDANTRGEAQEVFCDVVSALLYDLIKEGNMGNGLVIDTLGDVLDHFFKPEQVAIILDKWKEEADKRQ